MPDTTSTSQTQSEMGLSGAEDDIGDDEFDELTEEEEDEEEDEEVDDEDISSTISGLSDETDEDQLLRRRRRRVERKINSTFKSLQRMLRTRRVQLLKELKEKTSEAKNIHLVVMNDLSEAIGQHCKLVDVVQSDKKTASAHVANSSDMLSLENNNSNNNKNDTSSMANATFKCQLSGIGLVHCFVNYEASFIISFKNRRRLAKLATSPTNNNNRSAAPASQPQTATAAAAAAANVSFLDVYILKCDNDDENNNNNTPTAQRANTMCKMELLADGLYAIKYKLDTPGAYILNVMINKAHVDRSPFRLACLALNHNSNNNNNNNNMSIVSTTQRRQRLQQQPQITQQQQQRRQQRTTTSGAKTSHSPFNISSTSSSSASSRSPPLSSSSSPSALQKTSTRTPLVKQSRSLYNMSTSGSVRGSVAKPPLKKSSSTIDELRHTSVASNSSTSASPKAATRSESLIASTTNQRSTNNNNSNDDTTLNVTLPSQITNNETGAEASSTAVNDGGDDDHDQDLSISDDFLFRIGERGRGPGQFQNPQAICVTDALIFVTDSCNQKIDAFDHTGEFKYTLGANSRMIRRPVGIARLESSPASSATKLAVVDYEYKCLNVFDEASGRFLYRMCQNRLLGPKGVCVNRAHGNELVVVDSKANLVYVFSDEGKFLLRFGNRGAASETLSGPQYVCCMSNGDLVVTDFYNHGVKVFAANGAFRFRFGANGAAPGQFNGPTGVACDTDDNIVVVDWGNCRIQIFDKHGTFIKVLNSQANGLYGPQDVAVIKNTLAVSDSGNHCVKIFEYQ